MASRGPSAASTLQSLQKTKAGAPKAIKKSSDNSDLSGHNISGKTGSSETTTRRTRGRAVPKIIYGNPHDEWEQYLDSVISGRVCVLQIDRSTWLAELIDLDDEVLLVSSLMIKYLQF